MSEDTPPAGETLKGFLTGLAQADATDQPDVEEWTQTIERMHVTGRIHEITEETWFYFLEVSPPKIHGGSWFAFAEGTEPLTVFWQRRGKHYCRRLTDTETARVCDLAELPANYGM